MKTILFFGGLLFSFSLAAQFTLTPADFPTAGDVYRLHLSDTTGVTPGNSGTGVTWNFAASDSSVGMLVDSFKTVASTPYGANYSQANLALHQVSPSVNYFVYLDVTAAAASRVGNADATNTITYTNPATQYVFPLTYATTGTDTYSASYVDASSGSTVHIHGSSTVNADATGTLILPSGTYTNVMRVHYTRTEMDTIITTSNVHLPVSVTENFYLWYQAGDYYPVFHWQTTVNQVASAPASHRKVVGWRAGNPLAGITENNFFTIIVFPNPAAEKISIRATGTNFPKTIRLYDTNGKLVRTIENPGEYTELLIADLPKGFYMLTMNFADGKTESATIEHN